MRTPLLLLALALPAWADEDAAALRLADQTVMQTEHGGDWRVFAESALRASRPRTAGLLQHGARLSVDLRLDRMLVPGWRAVFADRLDLNRVDGTSGNQDINTLKEAYVSWQPKPDAIADMGRINVRNGVAMGYNPTDYFRSGALRSIVSLDPASLRENRMGVGMLRGQTLWEGGSLTALYAPKLSDQPSNASFSPDFGATNQRARWQLGVSQKLTDALNPQWLLSGGAAQSPQLGLNITALPNSASVAYLEWSGGRERTLAAQALGQSQDAAFRSRLATGLTYTTQGNLSLTAEYARNGAALDAAGWSALRQASPAAYGQYRNLVGQLQESPTRDQFFFYAVWQDALVKRLDVTAMLRRDLVDRSRLQWLEVRYHWSRVDLALQTQQNSGEPASNYGASAQSRLWQAVVRLFF